MTAGTYPDASGPVGDECSAAIDLQSVRESACLCCFGGYIQQYAAVGDSPLLIQVKDEPGRSGRVGIGHNQLVSLRSQGNTLRPADRAVQQGDRTRVV